MYTIHLWLSLEFGKCSGNCHTDHHLTQIRHSFKTVFAATQNGNSRFVRIWSTSRDLFRIRLRSGVVPLILFTRLSHLVQIPIFRVWFCKDLPCQMIIFDTQLWYVISRSDMTLFYQILLAPFVPSPKTSDLILTSAFKLLHKWCATLANRRGAAGKLPRERFFVESCQHYNFVPKACSSLPGPLRFWRCYFEGG